MSQSKSRLPALFNPASQTPEEIVENFVIRKKEFKALFDVIKADEMSKPPQHYIIQGQRGYGKSTLLLRLKVEIEKNKATCRRLIPVMFDEEQYGILNLARLWEEVIEILADNDKSFEPLAVKITTLNDSDANEEKIFNELIKELKKQKKKLVILLDNFNDLIEKFSRKEKQRLREVLLTSNCMRFICTSSAMMEFYYDYKEPFFDFFKVVTLNELDRDETIRLLKQLGETYGSNEIKKIIDEQPERIDALRRLTGGVPRTVVLLFEIFTDDVNGDSFKDLEAILDRVTPLYKHRLDSLSTQQQAIIDAIAQNWDAVSTKEIAAKVRMPSKAVSSQLNQLEKNQLIRKIPTTTKNQLYQISERFFNIYYLMRLGRRRNRNRVLWLVKFFEICCGEKELIERTKRHIKAIQEGRLYDRHAFYVSQALSKTGIPYDIQHELLVETKKCLSAQKSTYAKDIEPSHYDVLKEVIKDVKNNNIDKAMKKLRDDGFSQQNAKRILVKLLQKTGNLSKAIELYMEAIKYGDHEAMNNLAILYKTEFKDIKKAEKYYKMAIEKGIVEAMFNLALLYQTDIKDFEKAEKYYKMAVEKGNTDAMNNLALLYQTDIKDFEKAEEYYKMAVEKGNTDAMNNLAELYRTEFKDFKKAEQYYKMAADKSDAGAMNNLACLYFQQKKNKQETLHLQRAAFEKEKDIIFARGYLTILLWNDEIKDAIELFESYFNTEDVQREVNENISSVLILLMARRQFNYVYKVFRENKYYIRDKYKPVYYALLTLMGEKYADELKKMGGELKESVQDVLNEIKEMEKDFS